MKGHEGRVPYMKGQMKDLHMWAGVPAVGAGTGVALLICVAT